MTNCFSTLSGFIFIWLRKQRSPLNILLKKVSQYQKMTSQVSSGSFLVQHSSVSGFAYLTISFVQTSMLKTKDAKNSFTERWDVSTRPLWPLSIYVHRSLKCLFATRYLPKYWVIPFCAFTSWHNTILWYFTGFPVSCGPWFLVLQWASSSMLTYICSSGSISSFSLVTVHLNASVCVSVWWSQQRSREIDMWRFLFLISMMPLNISNNINNVFKVIHYFLEIFCLVLQSLSAKQVYFSAKETPLSAGYLSGCTLSLTHCMLG